MECRGLVVDYMRATGELTIHASTQAPHEVRLFCSRLLGLPEHRIRVVTRDTGGGFGQKVLVQRDEMCMMLAAPKVGAPLKWVEDRRENLLAAGKSRVEHGDVRMAFAADGAIEGAYIDFVQDCGAYPVALAGHDGGGSRRVLPRPVSRAPRRLHGEDDLYEHRRAGGVPGARGSSNHWRVRCCSTSAHGEWASIRPS